MARKKPTSFKKPRSFKKWKLGKLPLKNRIIKAATFEGLTKGSMPGDKLGDFHEKFAAGGSGVVTVAYGAVNQDARTFDDQMCVQEDAVIAELKKITSRIKAHGAAASIQLAHCGSQTKYSGLSGKPFAKSAKWGLNLYGLFSGIPFIRPLREAEILQIIEDYGSAAARAVEAGFDIIELHMGHGYLFSQFLSPAVNKRKDRWGGTIENRARFGRMAIQKVREQIGDAVPIIVKLNVEDGFKGGLTTEDAIEVAKMIESDGAATMLVLTGGFSSKNPMFFFRGPSFITPLIEQQKNFIGRMAYSLAARNFPDLPFQEMYFLEQARKFRAVLSMPIGLVGGIKSLASFETVIAEGFDAIVLGRTLIHEPNLPNLYETGVQTESGCITCNRCVAHIDGDAGVICPMRQELEQTAAA